MYLLALTMCHLVSSPVPRTVVGYLRQTASNIDALVAAFSALNLDNAGAQGRDHRGMPGIYAEIAFSTRRADHVDFRRHQLPFGTNKVKGKFCNFHRFSSDLV